MFRTIATFSRLGIAEAVELFGVSARALRLYEEVGLLEAGRDRRNQRYYAAEARRRIAWIVPLRGAGLSLHDIGEVFRREEEGEEIAASAVRKLKGRRSRLEEGLAMVEGLIEQLSVAESATSWMDASRPAPTVDAGHGSARGGRQIGRRAKRA